jgi:excisionase family DNA binding protein
MQPQPGGPHREGPAGLSSQTFRRDRHEAPVSLEELCGVVALTMSSVLTQYGDDPRIASYPSATETDGIPRQDLPAEDTIRPALPRISRGRVRALPRGMQPLGIDEEIVDEHRGVVREISLPESIPGCEHRPDETRRALSVPEAAQILGISRSHAYDLVRRRALPGVRLGRRILVPMAIIDEMLEPVSGQTT